MKWDDYEPRFRVLITNIETGSSAEFEQRSMGDSMFVLQAIGFGGEAFTEGSPRDNMREAMAAIVDNESDLTCVRELCHSLESLADDVAESREDDAPGPVIGAVGYAPGVGAIGVHGIGVAKSDKGGPS